MGNRPVRMRVSCTLLQRSLPPCFHYGLRGKQIGRVSGRERPSFACNEPAGMANLAFFLGVDVMRRKRVPPTWFRRVTEPVRSFLRVDLDMTQQALRRASPSTVAVMCAPTLFALWILDETEAIVADLKRLVRPRRTSAE